MDTTRFREALHDVLADAARKISSFSHPIYSSMCIVLDRLERVCGSPFSAFLLQTYHRTSAVNQGKNSLSDALTCLEWAWEQLHMVHYKDVAEEWRIAYTLASFLCALQEADTDLRSAMERLDMANVMSGSPVLGKSIEEFIETIAERLPMDDTQWPVLEMKDFDAPALTFKVGEMIMDEVSWTHLMNPQAQPFIIKDGVQHWPALSTRPWSHLSYLVRTVGQYRTVPVEIGSNYTDTSWGQRMMQFGEFVHHHVLQPEEHGIAYLAQHSLFNQVPKLMDDISIPEVCLLALSPNLGRPLLHSWFGPAGTGDSHKKS